MKKRLFAILIVAVFSTIGSFNVAAQSRFQFVFGPRVGATYIVTEWQKFDPAIQKMFPDPEITYYPIITQFGINLEQRIRLGSTESHFAFQEVLVIGGIDQNLFIPSLSVMIGFRSHTGLEFGLGPNLGVSMKNGHVTPTLTVVYAAGWTFSFNDVHIPVNVAVVPTPADGKPRVSLITGFNFGQ